MLLLSDNYLTVQPNVFGIIPFKIKADYLTGNL